MKLALNPVSANAAQKLPASWCYKRTEESCSRATLKALATGAGLLELASARQGARGCKRWQAGSAPLDVYLHLSAWLSSSK